MIAKEDTTISARAYRVLAGDYLLPLRLITGWTYFSAFWRRLILENKLDPDAAGYIGVKFNHFLPNAFVIKPAIEYFVSHPELLWLKLYAFTLVEAVVGLALMFGFMSRAAGIATSLLALGILLGAGWLGTTCLDEWQIGILGIAAGIAIAFAGGGRYSLDHLLEKRCPTLVKSRCWSWLSLNWLRASWLPRLTLISAVLAFGLALLTNQVFHGGLWGPLHNKSVRPLVELSNTHVSDDGLNLTLMRVEGADVYGSFLIGVRVLDETGNERAGWSAEQLSAISPEDINNAYVAKIQPGAHSLVLPLGAKADVLLRSEGLSELPVGHYTVELLDISGQTWTTSLKL